MVGQKGNAGATGGVFGLDADMAQPQKPDKTRSVGGPAVNGNKYYKSAHKRLRVDD